MQTIDTLKISKQLQQVDFSAVQADQFVAIFQSLYDGNSATKRDLSETELKLIKEIALVRSEMKETELKLIKEIVLVRSEIKETELKLTKEIESVRLEIYKSKSEIIKWVIGLLFAQTGILIAVFKLLQ